MKKLDSLTSADIVAQNIETLKQLFPTIVKEGRIDEVELKALLGEYVEDKEEYYRFTWAGKAEARAEANKPSSATLRPDKESSKDWDTTGNIFIEGDNLEVLKLLQKSYSNKIKMIYIDPPYNTGKDFVYRDNYKDNLANYLEQTGQLDDEGRKTSTNSESDGRYHSNWLNMMYPRLRLARNLMTEDGVIFISIDDNEQTNLKKLCDEVFGEENFVGVITWLKKRKGSFLSKKIISLTEYILVYSKSFLEGLYGGSPNSEESQPLVKRTNSIGELVFPENTIETKLEDGTYSKGFYGEGTSQVEVVADFDIKSNLIVSKLHLKAPFIWSQRMVDEQILEGAKFIINTKTLQVRVFRIYSDTAYKGLPSYIQGVDFSATNEDAYEQLRDIFKKENIMEYPKPINLLNYLINSATHFNTDALILDFFAGSGTTAHAVMQLNAEDGGTRKCISVQLPEPTDEKSEAYKAGYSVISDITKERIRRAGEKIKQDNKDKEGINKLDVGFKAFKLDSSNIRAWDSSKEALEQQLDLFVQNNGENIKAERTEEDILFEVLLKYGLDLSIPIEKRDVANATVYNIGFGSLFICLSSSISTQVTEGIGAWKEELQPASCRVIFKDTGFATDADKTNSMQIFKRFHITEVATI